MKQIFVGDYSRGNLFTAIRKTLLLTQVVLIAIIILFVLVPYLFSDKIFGNTKGSMSNVVYVETDGGSGSAVYIGNDYLLTAAHVIYGMGLNDMCAVVFEDPNSVSQQYIYAKAELLAMGNWNPSSKNIDATQDYALLHITTIDASKHSTPCNLGNSSNIKVSDKIKVVGYPGGTYSYTEGVVSSIKGAEMSDMFDVSATAWPGNSGGALLNTNGNLIGIVVLKGTWDVNDGKTYAIKIDKIKKELIAKGFQL